MADNFIAAIELGSSKITGVVGRKQPDGVIQISAFAQEPSTTFIRKGRINNVIKMTQCITSIKDKLEQKMQKQISRVYVGIGGMGMHTVANSVSRHFDSKVEITQEMIDAICDENRTSATADRDILESIPQEYRLGTQQTNDPVGVPTESIEGTFLNIVAGSSIREEIRNCFTNARVGIADLPITVLALADNILTEPEKRSGCVFVDMGAETTSVAIYKNNLLRHLAVIPLGGSNINRDLMSLEIEDDEAEELKLRYGTAIDEADTEPRPTITLRDGRNVKYEDFAGLVEARTEEIILNVKNQIALSKYDLSQLIGGLVITGGASNMRNIDKAFKTLIPTEKIRFVRSLRVPLRTPDYPNFNADGNCNAALALIDKGETNCCGGDLGQPGLFEETLKEDQEAQLTPEEKAAAQAEKQAREEEERRQAEQKAAAQAEEERRKKEKEEAEARKKARRDKWRKLFKKVGDTLGGLVKDEDE